MKLLVDSWIDKYSFHVLIHNKNLSCVSFEFISMKSYAIFHYWIRYYEFRLLNSHLFSVMNSYHEFMLMKSDSWIQIGYTMNFYIWIHILTKLWIHIKIQNLYIWIHVHEFIYSWIHIFISHMNSNVYEFI